MTPEQNAYVKTLTTREEIFDYVEARLKEQRCQSLSPDGHNAGECAYRGEEGLMCAVGCLIGDDEYTSGMEGRLVEDLTEDTLPDRLRPHVSMLQALQIFHDDAGNWSSHKGLSSRGIDGLRHLRQVWLTDSN